MTFVGAQANIATRAITVTADSKSKVYGDADPSFTYDITSGRFANGDTLTGAPAREVGEDVGTYTIRRGTLTAGDDYVLTFEPAKAVVDKAPLTVTADTKFREYGDANPPLTGIVVGVKNEDAVTGAYNTDATLQTGVGELPGHRQGGRHRGGPGQLHDHRGRRHAERGQGPQRHRRRQDQGLRQRQP